VTLEAAAFLGAKLLIVDDKQANVTLLERVLAGAGYTAVTSTLEPATVAQLHREQQFDLILLDLQMPGIDGFAVMEELKTIATDSYLPVLVITAQPDHKLRALRAGARDFISKPFDVAEVLMRVHNMLEVRLLHAEITQKNRELTKLFDEVVAERKVSERLALHVPPDSIAARLQARPDLTIDSYADVTVVVADIVGLADLTPTIERAALARLVDALFVSFEELATGLGARKVKTLGNSLLATVGVPAHVDDHAERAVRLSVAMLDAVEGLNRREGHGLQVRIGVASGAVTAGVIGRRMYLYDVWGEAVTIASRMESHGVAGRVQITGQTKQQLGDSFRFEERGTVDIEELGPTKTWFAGKLTRD